jgi:hypothetical protein
VFSVPLYRGARAYDGDLRRPRFIFGAGSGVPDFGLRHG